jgi:transposase
MPSTTLLEIPPEEQVQMLAVLRRMRYGYLLAFHIVLLCAAGRNPTEIAAFLFCSRSSVYRIVRVYRTGSLGIRVDQDGQLSIAVRMTVLMPWLARSLGAILKKAPRAYGWCRTRWSCATLAATLQAKHSIEVSAETVRRWLHELGWGWKRAKLVAKDDDPQRIERLARIRSSRAQARTTVGREFPISALSMAKRVPSPAIAHVSCTLSKIPYGGFSPVRLQAEVSPRSAVSFPLQA